MPRAKIPTKAELIQLQRLYKTDEKIAERLGGVTPQLVAYWRRKKNIPRHSFPKFSEMVVREIWERFGDDYRCGLELGISKAAFYNWRRKYGLKEKPAFLKLEQLELRLGEPHRALGRRHSLGQQTIVQKIISAKAGQEKVETGDVIGIEPDLVVTPIDSAFVAQCFRDNGFGYVWNPSRVVIALDQRHAGDMEKGPAVNKAVREFIKKQSIKHFYDIGEGACHQVVIENGQILPGQFAVGTDPNIYSFGSIGCFSTFVSPTEMAVIWAAGKISVTVPQTAKIVINGKPPRSVGPRDVALSIGGKLHAESVQNKIAEFYGATISQMTIPDRFSLCHNSGGTGFSGGICPFDTITRRFFLGRTKMPYRPALADKDAVYSDLYEFNISHLVPQIAHSGKSGDIGPVADLEGTPINQVVIGSCAGGRFEDLRTVAEIIKGKKINPEVRLFIYPASKAAYLEALRKGFIRAFIEAGALVMNPGCGPCKSSYSSILAEGERCLSTAGINSGNNVGDSGSETYIVSAATAAASALRGVITDPTGFVKS